MRFAVFTSEVWHFKELCYLALIMNDTIADVLRKLNQARAETAAIQADWRETRRLKRNAVCKIARTRYKTRDPLKFAAYAAHLKRACRSCNSRKGTKTDG